MPGDRVLVITALPVERQAVVEILGDVRRVPAEDGTIYTRGTLETPRRRTYDIWVATCDDAGNSVSSAQTVSSLGCVKPRYAFFVGIAGAFKDADLGDVVFANFVEGYETAAVKEAKWQARPRVFQAHHRLTQAAFQVLERNTWNTGLEFEGRGPRAHIKPVASGEKVHKDSEADLVDFIRTHYGDAIAVEMEGRGFYEGLRHHPLVLGAVIRGISDRVDDKDRLDPAICQPAACRYAVRFMSALLDELPEPQDGPEDAARPSILRFPHPENAYFEGREADLDRLREGLVSENRTVIVQTVEGNGGVGKTHLAIEYVYRYLTKYALVCWLDAGDPVALAGQYAGLAGDIDDLKHLAEGEQPVAVEAVHQWLSRAGPWLLVLDNAEGPASVQDYIPRGKGHVIVTSRNPEWGTLARTVRLDLWPPETSVAFLLRRTESTDERAARAVAGLLGNLPLALEHAGAYVKATGRSLADYARLLETEGLGLLDDADVVRDRDPVSATWAIALARLDEGTPEAAHLMRLLAFLAPEGLPVSLLLEGSPALSGPLESALSSEAKANRPIAALRRYGLLEPSTDTLSVHRVLRHVVRASLSRSETARWADQAAKLISSLFPTESDDPRHWDRCADLVPHVHALVDQPATRRGREAATSALNQAAVYLHARAAYAEAEPLYRRALEIGEKTLGREHPSVATWLNNLAGLLEATGRYAEAEPLYRRALEISEKTLGPEHRDVARGLNNLAGLLHATGRYEEAEPLYRRTLEIGEKILGPEHPAVATRLNNLALLLDTTGWYEEAEPLFRRCLEIGEKTLGPEHPDVAAWLNNLALLLKATERYEEAEPLYRRALQISEKTLGPEHPAVATSLNNLALLLADTGRYEEAEPLYRRALEIGEKTLGPEHPSVANRLNNLAGLLYATGRYEEAEPLYRRALEISEKTLGPEHPSVATGLNNLAMLLRATGRYEEAEPLYRRALEIAEKNLGPQHPNVALYRRNLAALLETAGLPEERRQ